MEININLYTDWTKLIIQRVKELELDGFIFPKYDEWKNNKLNYLNKQKIQLEKGDKPTDHIDKQFDEESLKKSFEMHSIHTYFNFEYRLIESKPRNIHYSSKFNCPPHLKNGLTNLEKKIKNGNSLFPYLSRGIFNATKLDGMLFDWGIQHLHLGIAQDKKKPQLVQATKEIVYTIFRENDAYFIVIDEHGHWANKDLFRIIKNDFPFLIEPFKLKGVLGLSHSYMEKEHIELRDAGINTITDIDGDFYMSPGGGINTAKGSALVMIRMQNISRWYKIAEGIFKEELVKKIKEIEEIDNSIDKNELTFNFTMDRIENDRITVIDHGNNLRMILFYNKDRNGFQFIKIESIS